MPYIPFTDEQKVLANSVDLEQFLRMRGEKLERVGREHKLIYCDSSGRHDSITIRGSKWFDHKNQTGGGAIKFMQEFYGMDFQTAVQELLGRSISPLSNSPPKADKQEQKTREFKLPEPNSDMHRVYAYLIKQRFISADIITHFAKQHTLYEDKTHHNAVFVGLNENGEPKQAHKRSTNSVGGTFRITCGGSDTRYSFAHFGENERLYVFEAPIDMLSFLTLYPKDWQKHSYIAMNGVYENAVLTALKNHSNLSEVILCVDNDEGGIEAADRLRYILNENGYSNVKRLAPPYKDWNEVLKEKNGVYALPAVPNKHKEEYHCQAENLQYLKCRPDKLTSQIYAAFKNEQYKYLAEYALAGSAFFIDKSCEKDMFAKLRAKLKAEYKPYTDKGKAAAKQRNLQECVTEVMKDLRQTARTREQSVNTAKLLYQLADRAVRLSVEETLSVSIQEQNEDIDIVPEPEPCMEFS
ncbi:toprim domain-containing protein [Ruminococcus bicirculans (ex Wegman et al. 2014)]|uniref:toprim domain-containing protein n=1 Tax=Ruminococcus bicirculans (ex Wegman et al. 2014) TaxID=1160721 RepID=UPI004027E814